MEPRIFADLAAAFFKIRFLGKKIPLKVSFHITYRCNLSCPFCWRSQAVLPEMDTAQIKSMMAEFRKMGALFWVFNGGEPLLRQDLGELIDYAKTIGFHTSLVTNGVLLKEKLVNEPPFGRLDYVQLSLEGPEDIHDMLCGNGSYDKAVSSLEILKKKKIKRGILSLIAEQNIDFFDDLIEIADGLGATIMFQPVVLPPGEAATDISGYLPGKDRFRGALSKLMRKKREGAPIASSMAYLALLSKHWPHIPHGMSCYAGRYFCNIDPQGNIFPCCSRLNQSEHMMPGLGSGFQKAFFELKDASCCSACYYFGPQEINLIFKMMGVRL